MSSLEAEVFRSKSPDCLAEQAQAVSERIRYSIVPSSLESCLNEVDGKTIKARFPNRFGIYAKTLRAIRREDDGNFVTEDEEEQNRRAELIANWQSSAPLVDNLNRYVAAHYQGDICTLRGRQMTVFEDVRDFIDDGSREGYIEAPTGFGKTVLFGQVVAAVDTTTTIVVPTRRLVEQTYRSLRRFNPGLEVGRVYSDRKEYGRQVTITTYASLVRSSESEDELRNRAQTNLVIFDEMHEAISERRIRAGETFPNAILLGLSASPVLVSDQRFTDQRIAQMTQNEIHNIPFREAVEEGYISPFSAWLVEVDADISNVRIISGGDYDEKELEKILNEKTANQAAVQFFLQAKREDIRRQRQMRRKNIEPLTTAVYASSVAHAQALAEEYQSVGVTAAAVWGEQDHHEQERIMRQFASGEIEVVCSKDLLVRGIDVPRIRMVMNVAPTASETVEKQRSGRGLRIFEQYPDKHTIIADFVYRNSNRHNAQITFPQVVRAARIEKSEIDGAVGPGVEGPDIVAPIIEVQGLRVITDPEEVMTIVRSAIEAQREEILPLQETDFAITAETIVDTFQGDSKINRRIAKEVLVELQKLDPNNVSFRRSGVHIVPVVDKNVFVREMEKRNIKLKSQEIEKVKSTDFPLTQNNLDNKFIGGWVKLRPIIEQIKDDLSREHPEYFATRNSADKGAQYISVVTAEGQQDFFKAMTAAGIEFRSADTQDVQNTDLLITKTNLTRLFVGHHSRLVPIARSICTVLQTEHPEYFVKRKNGRKYLEVIHTTEGTNEFIQAMISAGVELR